MVDLRASGALLTKTVAQAFHVPLWEYSTLFSTGDSPQDSPHHARSALSAQLLDPGFHARTT